MRFYAILALWLAIVAAALFVACPVRAAEADVTVRQVDNWIVAYSVARSSASYPYRSLVADARRVIACESGEDLDVINGRKVGARGEVGPAQFLPGPGSIFWKSSAAAAGYDYFDVEANVAATVELISLGYGPGNWTCW